MHGPLETRVLVGDMPWGCRAVFISPFGHEYLPKLASLLAAYDNHTRPNGLAIVKCLGVQGYRVTHTHTFAVLNQVYLKYFHSVQWFRRLNIVVQEVISLSF